MKKTAWLISVYVPNLNVAMWFYESIDKTVCVTQNAHHATHFESKLKAEEYLLNLKFVNRDNENVQMWEVKSVEIELGY